MNTYAIVAVSILALVVVGGGIFYYNAMYPEGQMMKEKGEDMLEEGEKMMKEGEDMMGEGEKMIKEGEEMMEGKTSADALSFSGIVLAGSASPLIDFNKADYDAAKASGKLVVLYFYATWCPVCKTEFPKMQSVFDSLEGNDVVGFRVNFNDNETDADEVALAREFGVAYQHTKVFLKDGARVLKSPESWDEARYRLEISKNSP